MRKLTAAVTTRACRVLIGGRDVARFFGNEPARCQLVGPHFFQAQTAYRSRLGPRLRVFAASQSDLSRVNLRPSAGG